MHIQYRPYVIFGTLPPIQAAPQVGVLVPK